MTLVLEFYTKIAYVNSYAILHKTVKIVPYYLTFPISSDVSKV